jgi:hypothetical protein
MKRLVLLCLSIGLLNTAKAQIVNIEARRLRTDSVRLVTDMALAFLLNSTNGKTLTTVRGNVISQWKSKNYKHLILAAANYDFAQADKDDFVNSMFVHLRYNYKVNPWLRWEAFMQGQTNEPLGINYRHLVGTGPRFKIRIGPHADIYIGSLAMYEYERTIPPTIETKSDLRWSNYLSLNIHIPKVNGSLISTYYYQPLFKDFTDYRVMNDTRLDLNITAAWRVYTRFTFLHDSQPPTGIRRNALNLEQGFGFTLR